MGSKNYDQKTDFEMRQLEAPVRFGDYENGNYTKFNTDGTQEIYVNGVASGSVQSQFCQLTPPSILTKTFPVPFNVYKKGSEYTTNIGSVINSYKPTGKEYFVRAVNGNDSNDGLTYETAYKTPDKALDQSDGVVITIDPEGQTFDRISWDNATSRVFSTSKHIRSYDGSPITIFWGDPQDGVTGGNWTKKVGYTNVYEVLDDTTLSNAYRLVNTGILDEYGEPKEYTLVADIATVDSTPGSYYKDGSLFYAHDFQSGVVDSSAFPLFGANRCIDVRVTTAGQVFCFEDLNIIGGDRNVYALNNIASSVDQPDTLLIMQNCSGLYAYGQDSFQILGVNTYCINTKFAKPSSRDAFNYHESDTQFYSGVFVEIDCIGRECSNVEGGTTDNATTSHEAYQGIRVNGSYYNTSGPTMIDVGDSKSWNVGCFAENSGTNQTISSGNGFDAGITEMVLEGQLAITKDEWVAITNGSIIGTITESNTINNFVKTDSVDIAYDK